MFIWTELVYPSVEAVHGGDNRRLGNALGSALAAFPQKDPEDLWEVTFDIN